MANSFGTVATNVIAQEALTRLVKNLRFLQNCHADFSTEALAKGQNVTTHIVADQSAADFGTDGYKAGDATQTGVAVPLNKHKHVTFSLSDGERDSSQVSLFERFAESAAYGLGKAVVDHIFNAGTGGTIAGASQSVSLSASGLDLEALINLGAEMDAAGVPETGRWLVAHPSVLANLEKDVVGITNATFNVGGTLTNGGVSRIRGFDLFAYNNASLETGAGKVGAYAGFRDSLAVVTAAPSLPPEAESGSLSYVTEPNTGLTVQQREWYDMKLAEYNFTLTLYFGAKLTAGNRLWKVVNA